MFVVSPALTQGGTQHPSGDEVAGDGGDGSESTLLEGGSVLFSDQLPAYAAEIREALAQHASLQRQGKVDCRADGSIPTSAPLRSARESVKEALQRLGPDADPAVQHGDFGVEDIFRDYRDVLPGCPQAVLQSSAAYLDRTLGNLLSACSELSLVRACQGNAAFMFDAFVFHIMLREGLIDLYASTAGGNTTAADVFRGWPILEQERRVWSGFALLWRLLFEGRDYCACVEGYDYYTTLHALFDQAFRIRREDFPRRVLQRGTDIQRAVAAADHCEEWLSKDFLRIFASYAKHSACLPGAIMENIICMHRWILAGQVVGAVNTAEMMLKLLTLGGTCLEDTSWPFTRADVLHNFGKLALNWQEADVGCQAMNRFGQRLSREPCPTEVPAPVVKRLLWSSSPLAATPEGFQLCTADISPACILDGVVAFSAQQQQQWATASGVPNLVRTTSMRQVGDTSKWILQQQPALSTCSEVGRNRHAVKLLSGEEVSQRMATSEAGSPVGFVLNTGQASDNIWHNLHWVIPAIVRLHSNPSVLPHVPHNVEILLLFDGYVFTELPPELFKDDAAPSSTPTAPPGARGDVKEASLEETLKPFAFWLTMISSLPPVLLRDVKRRCYRTLLWGHGEMRADRELNQRDALSSQGMRTFRATLGGFHGSSLQQLALDFWGRAAGSDRRILVAFVQRDPAHGRSFEDVDALGAATLDPLVEAGGVSWRLVDALEKKPLIQQAAIFFASEVLIGAVGAALAWLAVMRPGGQVLEWLPRGVAPVLYRCTEQWDTDILGMFGGLGRLACVSHVCLRSETRAEQATFRESRLWTAVKTSAKEAYWRRWNLRPDRAKFARWAAEAVQRAMRSRPQAWLERGGFR